MKMFLQVEIVFDRKNDAWDLDHKFDKESIYQSIFDILDNHRNVEMEMSEMQEFANLRCWGSW